MFDHKSLNYNIVALVFDENDDDQISYFSFLTKSIVKAIFISLLPSSKPKMFHQFFFQSFGTGKEKNNNLFIHCVPDTIKRQINFNIHSFHQKKNFYIIRSWLSLYQFADQLDWERKRNLKFRKIGFLILIFNLDPWEDSNLFGICKIWKN